VLLLFNWLVRRKQQREFIKKRGSIKKEEALKLGPLCNKPFPLSKRVLVQNYSYRNEFNLKHNERARKTHLNMKGYSLILVLKQR